MPKTSPLKAPQASPEDLLTAHKLPSKVRYGLMNTQGEYLVTAYETDQGWREWHHEPVDPIDWVDLDSAYAAAKVWHQIKGCPLVVVAL